LRGANNKSPDNIKPKNHGMCRRGARPAGMAAETSEWTMEMILIGAAFGLTGIVWVSRERFNRRFNSALDAYAELEINRERPRTVTRPPHQYLD
jgi:hypothetical protein